MERLNLSNILEIKNLKRSFGGVKAVDGCSFEIESGKIIAMIGPNGSGKTTVFNLISGILSVDSGKIILDGSNITDNSVEERARLGISRMYQQSRLFKNLTVKENLLLVLDQRNFNFFARSKPSTEQTEQINEILDLFELNKKINMPVKTLSFGQRRLIEIARTYLLPHKIMLLDEPVAGVTPHLRNEISKFLTKLKDEGETILIIEHDMNFVYNLVDEVVVMDAGKIIAHGNPIEIEKNQKVKEAYLGA